MVVTAAINAIREVESYNDDARRRGTVTAGTDIPKNSLLKLEDDNTFSQSTGAADIIAGVSSDDKEGDDPSTSIGVYGPGIFEFTASGSITAGDNVVSGVAGGSGANVVKTAGDVSTATQIIVGSAINSASDAERVRVRMNL